MHKQWCIARVDGEFLARMEDVLALYARPYDARQPVVCFDERPCQLLAEVQPPLAARSGVVQRTHYAYQRMGTCALLVAFEPLTGWRHVQVVEHRTKQEYAAFVAEVLAHFPQAERVYWVQDNLSTHKKGALYEHLPPEQAFALAQRLDFHFTPVGASWLNMVEIELSVLARQCLNRRIPSVEQLTQEVNQLVKERNQQKATVHWQFTTQHARTKLKKWFEIVYAKT